jgi:hypothetical protein
MYEVKYTGPIGGSLQECMQTLRAYKSNSKFAQHILDTQLAYDTVEELTDILHIEKRVPC